MNICQNGKKIMCFYPLQCKKNTTFKYKFTGYQHAIVGDFWFVRLIQRREEHWPLWTRGVGKVEMVWEGDLIEERGWRFGPGWWSVSGRRSLNPGGLDLWKGHWSKPRGWHSNWSPINCEPAKFFRFLQGESMVESEKSSVFQTNGGVLNKATPNLKCKFCCNQHE